MPPNYSCMSDQSEHQGFNTRILRRVDVAHEADTKEQALWLDQFPHTEFLQVEYSVATSVDEEEMT